MRVRPETNPTASLSLSSASGSTGISATTTNGALNISLYCMFLFTIYRSIQYRKIVPFALEITSYQQRTHRYMRIMRAVSKRIKPCVNRIRHNLNTRMTLFPLLYHFSEFNNQKTNSNNQADPNNRHHDGVNIHCLTTPQNYQAQTYSGIGHPLTRRWPVVVPTRSVSVELLLETELYG